MMQLIEIENSMINSERLEAGEVIAGYTLKQKLSKHKFFMSTWRATNPQGEDLALNIYSTTTYDGDHGFNAHDLHPPLQALLPTLDALKGLPPITGLAPLLDYHYTPQSPVLALIRKFYPERLADHYLPGETAAADVMKLTGQIASVFDALRQHIPQMSFFITPEHLMLDGEQVMVVDYGIEKVLKTIDFSYYGARPLTARWRYEMGWYPSHFFTTVPAEYALAMLYYYFRTGYGVFENRSIPATDAAVSPEYQPEYQIDWVALTRRGEQGDLPEPLQTEKGEWAVIRRALNGEYTSCQAIIRDLSTTTT